METLIYILKAHLLFMILGGIYHFSLRNEKSFTFNRFYLLAIYGVSIVAPLLDFQIFTNITLINPSFLGSEPVAETLGNKTPLMHDNALTIGTILPFIYSGIVTLSIVIFLVKFIKSYWQFQAIYQSAKFDFKQKIYWSEEDIVPFTFLNKTIIPKKLKNDLHQDVIIKHEEAHRKSLHFLDILAVEIISCFLFLNPLNKKIKKYLIENHEFLADQYALKVSERNSYAQILIQQTLNQSQFNFASYFAKPTILNRLNMLENNKKTTFKPILVGFSLLIISFLFSCNFSEEEEVILNPKTNLLEIADAASADQNIDEGRIFSIVEKQAEPKEGIQNFYDNIKSSLKGRYPQQALSMGIEGAVYVQFVIEKDGALSNVKAVKGIGAGCDELAVELLKQQGKWMPGKQNGRKVRSRRVIPIRFVLN